jgi:transcriptional regulator with XRE-family HTH domain
MMGRSQEDEFGEEEFLRKLGSQITKIRTSKGYSQDRLTLESGLSRGTLSKIESAKVSVKTATLARIAHTLGVPLRKLLDFEI